MKKLLALLSLLILLTSCQETWNGSTKRKFHEACTDEAIKWAGTPEVAKTYCDCVLDKMMKKYPHEMDAFEHFDSLAVDPDLIRCKEEVTKKQ